MPWQKESNDILVKYILHLKMKISELGVPEIIALFAVLVGSVVALFVAFQKWDSAGGKSKKSSDSQQDRVDAAEEEYKSLMEKHASNKTFGKTDKYEWTQTETEVEVYIPYPGTDLSSRNVKVTMKANTLEVKIHNVVVVQGEFFGPIQPDDSCWVIDAAADGKKQVWLTLFKANSGIWRHILMEDAKDSHYSSMPPVHAVNPADPASIREAVRKLKEEK